MAVKSNVRDQIKSIAAERVVILDGAMGSVIQAWRNPSGEPLGEGDFRGERFKEHTRPLKGCSEALCLSMPDLILGIHEEYLKAGADIIETCSFNATSVSLADRGLGDLTYELSAASAALARKAADAYSTAAKPRFVAGSMGPTSKSAGILTGLDDPGKRAITWDELEKAYYDNARGLLDGGADLIIIETVFDTLNARAAIFSVRRLAEERGIDVPLIVSATVGEGGRLLSGQSAEAFCVSVLHADPLALGLNCSFGAEKLKPHIAALSCAAPCLVSAYPNAGLPNRYGAYDEDPGSMADHIEEYLQAALVNIVGGCCGSTPAHIAAIAERAAKYAPRPVPPRPGKTLLAGLEVQEISRKQSLAEIRERSGLALNGEFHCFIKNGEYDDAAETAREAAEAGAALIDACIDENLPGAKAALTSFLNYALQYPDLARLPVMLSSRSWDLIEAGLKCLPGKGLVNSLSLNEGEADFRRKARLVRAYGAALVVTLPDKDGEALTTEQVEALSAHTLELLSGLEFPPEDIFFDLCGGLNIPSLP